MPRSCHWRVGAHPEAPEAAGPGAGACGDSATGATSFVKVLKSLVGSIQYDFSPCHMSMLPPSHHSPLPRSCG